MWPLASANTDSVCARTPRSSLASRTLHGSTSNGGVMRAPRRRRLPSGGAGLRRRLTPLASPGCPGPHSNTVPSRRAPRAAPERRAWARTRIGSVSCAPLAGGGVEQGREVGDDHVRAVLAQRVSLAGAVHADHVAEVAGPAGLHARERVLEHRSLGGRHAEG